MQRISTEKYFLSSNYILLFHYLFYMKLIWLKKDFAKYCLICTYIVCIEHFIACLRTTLETKRDIFGIKSLTLDAESVLKNALV